jgi:hypothetical protein
MFTVVHVQYLKAGLLSGFARRTLFNTRPAMDGGGEVLSGVTLVLRRCT